MTLSDACNSSTLVLMNKTSQQLSHFPSKSQEDDSVGVVAVTFVILNIIVGTSLSIVGSRHGNLYVRPVYGSTIIALGLLFQTFITASVIYPQSLPCIVSTVLAYVTVPLILAPPLTLLLNVFNQTVVSQQLLRHTKSPSTQKWFNLPSALRKRRPNNSSNNSNNSSQQRDLSRSRSRSRSQTQTHTQGQTQTQTQSQSQSQGLGGQGNAEVQGYHWYNNPRIPEDSEHVMSQEHIIGHLGSNSKDASGGWTSSPMSKTSTANKSRKGSRARKASKDREASSDDYGSPSWTSSKDNSKGSGKGTVSSVRYLSANPELLNNYTRNAGSSSSSEDVGLDDKQQARFAHSTDVESQYSESGTEWRSYKRSANSSGNESQSVSPNLVGTFLVAINHWDIIVTCAVTALFLVTAVIRVFTSEHLHPQNQCSACILDPRIDVPILSGGVCVFLCFTTYLLWKARMLPNWTGIFRETMWTFLVCGFISLLSLILILSIPAETATATTDKDSSGDTTLPLNPDYGYLLLLAPNIIFFIYAAWPGILTLHSQRKLEKKFQDKDRAIIGEISRDYSMLLGSVLRDPPLKAKFEQHLQTEFCPEMIRFYEAAKAFEENFSVHSENTRLIYARRLTLMFVSNGSPMQINISAKLREEVETRVGLNKSERTTAKSVLGSYPMIRKGDLKSPKSRVKAKQQEASKLLNPVLQKKLESLREHREEQQSQPVHVRSEGLSTTKSPVASDGDNGDSHALPTSTTTPSSSTPNPSPTTTTPVALATNGTAPTNATNATNANRPVTIPFSTGIPATSTTAREHASKDGVSKPSTVTADLFADARKEVIKLMVDGPFPRFVSENFTSVMNLPEVKARIATSASVS